MVFINFDSLKDLPPFGPGCSKFSSSNSLSRLRCGLTSTSVSEPSDDIAK